MYFVINANDHAKKIFILNNNNIDVIKNSSSYLYELILIMENTNTESCEINIYDNYYKIFENFFIPVSNDTSIKKIKKKFSMIKNIGMVPYIFLRLKLSDQLSFDDVYISCFLNNISMKNLLDDFKKYEKFTSKHETIDEFMFNCLVNISNENGLKRIFSINNIDFLKKNFSKIYLDLCIANPWINECNELYNNHEICIIQKIKDGSIHLFEIEGHMQTEKICLEAVKKNGYELKYVKDQTVEICLEAVKENWQVLHCVINQTNEICLEAVKQNGYALEYVKNQTNEICLEAVKKKGLALHYVINQTDEICLEAVKQYGESLRAVKNKTHEICLEAVKQHAYALEYVENPTEEMCWIAINKDMNAIMCIRNPTDEMCLEVLKKDGLALRYIRTQTNEMCEVAVQQNGMALEYVNKQSKKICDLAHEQCSYSYRFVNHYKY